MKRKFAVLVNCRSRSGSEILELVQNRLGGEAQFVAELRKPNDLASAVTRAESHGIHEIWIGGGDGTVGSLASACLGKEMTIGILPLGTGNALARELEIPLDPNAAIDFLLDGSHPIKMDLGKFNSSVFVTVATLGLTSQIVESLKDAPKGRFGRLVYFPAVLQAMRNFSTLHISIETDGDSFEGLIAQLVIANTRLHAGPFVVTKHASADDGLLSIYVVAERDRKGLLRYGWALLSGRQTSLENVWFADTKKASIICKRMRRFVLDGDPVRAQTVEVESLRHELTIFANK